MILVTGARGNVRHVVSSLLAEGASVRALTRDPTSARWPDDFEVTRGDLSEAATLDAALDDVDAVFLLWHQPSAEHPDAASEAIARHTNRVVYVSSLTVDDDLAAPSDDGDPRRHRTLDPDVRSRVDVPAGRQVRDQLVRMGA